MAPESRVLGIYRGAENIAEFLCGLLGLIILVISLVQIALRVGFSIALPWVFELTSLFTVYAVFSGAVVLILGDRTAQVELLTRFFPAWIRRWLKGIMAIASLAMGVSVIAGTWVYWGLLSAYTMSNLPLSSTLFAYPIFLFGAALVWRPLLYLLNIEVRSP